jgi:chorismate dehydratase
MKKLKIAAVSYINTWPFLAGLKRSELASEIELFLVPPSQCARLFEEGTVDVALTPVGVLPEMRPHKMITDFGICCDGAVRTVALMSQVEMEKIEAVQLDADSKTSNLLVQILARDYWKKDWHFFHTDDVSHWEKKPNCARIAIGDKVFALEEEVTFKWDLGTAWKSMTGLPFTFAVWISDPELSKKTENLLNLSFLEGVQSIDTMKLDRLQHQYLKENISYHLDNKKREAMDQFLDQIQTFALQHSI